MIVLSTFRGFFCAVATMIIWASPSFAENFSSPDYFNEDALPADMYLRLSDLHCEDCTLVVRDLIEIGVVSNTIGAVKSLLNDDLNYTFRLQLLNSCNHCYRAVHFWEMNMLNRLAANEEISPWLESEQSKPLVEYFSRL